jgi:hypothetical protein
MTGGCPRDGNIHVLVQLVQVFALFLQSRLEFTEPGEEVGCSATQSLDE